MRILDRYITGSIVTNFIAAVVTFAFLFVLIDSASNLDEFIDRGVTFRILLQYYAWYTPVILIQASSIACLIAVLFAYGSLNNHNEVIVLRASGLHFWKIARPAIFFSLLVSAAIFLINEKYIPAAEEMTKRIETENFVLEGDRKKKDQKVINNLTFYGLKNRLYFIEEFDPNTYNMKGVTILGYDNKQNVTEKIVALKGDWTGIGWKFYQTQVTSFSYDPQEPTRVKVYPEKLVDIKESPGDFLTQRLDIRAMNIRQLNQYISRFADSGATRALNNLRVDLHEKFSFPFSPVVIVLLGLPLVLGTGSRRPQTFASLGIAISIGLLYYVCNAVGLALGKGGLFPPFVAAWMAPALFGGTALYVIKKKF